MKIILVENFTGKVVETSDSLAQLILQKTGTNEMSSEFIPYKHISCRRGNLPLPEEWLDPATGRLRTGIEMPLVRLTFTDGSARFAVNEKGLAGRDHHESCSDEIQQLFIAMEHGESQECEFKTSLFYPPDTEHNDSSYQRKNLIRELHGFALGQSHCGTLYVGIRDVGSKRIIVGVEGELAEKRVAEELLQADFMNLMKQMCGEGLLLATDFKWLRVEGHLVARIRIEYTGDVIFYGPSRSINVRVGSAVHTIEDPAAYTAFIRNYIH